MRWLTLYARSRRVPASIAAALISAAAVWGLAQAMSDGPADPGLAALVPVAGVAATATGLSGQDPALDRTAAIRWAPRRAAYVLLIAAFAAAVLSVLLIMGDDPAPAGFVVRDSAGLTGLAPSEPRCSPGGSPGHFRSPGSRSRSSSRPRPTCRSRWRPGCCNRPPRPPPRGPRCSSQPPEPPIRGSARRRPVPGPSR